MKKLSERSDVVVVGAGLAGICAAVTAAREGALVSLVEACSSLGGRVGKELRFPLEEEVVTNFAYFRETGLLDEILLDDLALNHEGDHEGRERVLNEIVRSQERLRLFTSLTVVEAETSAKKDKILSVTGIDHSARARRRFRAGVFIDCADGALANLAGAPGERGAEQGEYDRLTPLFGSGASAPENRHAITLSGRSAGSPVPFEAPSWTRIRWEDNEPAARIAFIESFLENPEGVHLAEWAAPLPRGEPLEAAEIAYAAWDHLKNRSRFAQQAENYVLARHSPVTLCADGFRIKGASVLTPEEMEKGEARPDHVALGRAPLDGPAALLSSPIGRIALPAPYGVPLPCLYSKKVRNLLVAGAHASGTHRASVGLRHPPTSAQLGEAAGIVAALSALTRRQPRTLAKPGHVEKVRIALSRRNHACGPEPVEDLDDLARTARATASTTLSCCSLTKPLRPATPTSADRLLQFPVVTSELKCVALYVEAKEDAEWNLRLLAGSANGSTLPGDCLDTATVFLAKGPARWVEIPFTVPITSPGWHFLEMKGEAAILPYLQDDAPAGVLRHRPASQDRPGVRNPYSDSLPVLPALPGPGPAYCFRLSPKQPCYAPANVTDGHARPNHLPRLWISEPTDFRYPEFLELNWDGTETLTRIDLVFDPTLEFAFPSHPVRLPVKCVSSLVRAYRIYLVDALGRSSELLTVTDNRHGFRSHEFPPKEACGIELEVLSTHGLKRAQVYQVKAYP